MHNFVYLAQRRSQKFSCEPNFGGGACPPAPSPRLRQWVGLSLFSLWCRQSAYTLLERSRVYNRTPLAAFFHALENIRSSELSFSQILFNGSTSAIGVSKAINSLTWSGDQTVDIDSCSAEMSERYFVSRRVATCSMPTRIVVPGSSKWCDLMSITWHSRNVLPSLLCTWCAPVNDSARSYTLIYIDLSISTHSSSTGTSAGFWLGRSIIIIIIYLLRH